MQVKQKLNKKEEEEEANLSKQICLFALYQKGYCSTTVKECQSSYANGRFRTIWALFFIALNIVCLGETVRYFKAP